MLEGEAPGLGRNGRSKPERGSSRGAKPGAGVLPISYCLDAG